MSAAPVTEAHKRLVATIVERAFRFAEGNHKITPELSQLIADSEAKATAELRAERARLDWLEENAGDIQRYNSSRYIWSANQNLRAAIDAAMKEGGK